MENAIQQILTLIFTPLNFIHFREKKNRLQKCVKKFFCSQRGFEINLEEMNLDLMKRFLMQLQSDLARGLVLLRMDTYQALNLL